MGLFNYDASVLDNPYLRSNNFYGYDTVDMGDDDRWTDLFGDFTLPILANIGIAGFYDDNVLLNNLNRRGSFGTTLTPSLTMPFGSDKVFTTLNYSLRANLLENLSFDNTIGNYLNGSTSFEFDRRNHMVLSARWASAEDPLGTLLSQGSLANILRQPNHWNGYGFDASYRYQWFGRGQYPELRIKLAAPLAGAFQHLAGGLLSRAAIHRQQSGGQRHHRSTRRHVYMYILSGRESGPIYSTLSRVELRTRVSMNTPAIW
jgi:hypothetical protein